MSALENCRPDLHQWLDHLLPAHCVLCGLYCRSGRLCPPCREDLPQPVLPCKQCALPGLSSDVMMCGVCQRNPPPWKETLAGLVYEYPVDQLVHRFKFRRNLACGQLLADELLSTLQNTTTSYPDVIFPVPLHYSRFFVRGFNQAEFLARHVAAFFNIPVLIDCLRRTRRTVAQSGLDHSSRRRNVRGAFTCRALAGENIVLVDDVMTTGTTLRACASSVLAAGAGSVSVWVAARVPTPV